MKAARRAEECREVFINAVSAFHAGKAVVQIAADVVQFIPGGTIALSEWTALDLGVSGDLRLGTSLDVVFYLNLHKKL